MINRSAHPNNAPKKPFDDDSFLSASATSCNAFCSLSAMTMLSDYFLLAKFFRRLDSLTALNRFYPSVPRGVITTLLNSESTKSATIGKCIECHRCQSCQLTRENIGRFESLFKNATINKNRAHWSARLIFILIAAM